MKFLITSLVCLIACITHASDDWSIRSMSVGTKISINRDLPFLNGQEAFELPQGWGTKDLPYGPANRTVKALLSSTCNMVITKGATQNGALTLTAPIEMTVVSVNSKNGDIVMGLSSNKPNLEKMVCYSGQSMEGFIESIQFNRGTVVGPNDRFQ